MLGLPQSLVPERLQIEVQVEKSSLVANEFLGSIFRAHRRAGTRIIAISDTTLPSEESVNSFNISTELNLSTACTAAPIMA